MNQAHVVYLQRRHRILEEEIAEALRCRSVDDLMVVDLKCRKLHVMGEIERLRQSIEARVI